MTINSENSQFPSDAHHSDRAYPAGNTGLNSPGSFTSDSPYPASPGSDAITGSAYTGRPSHTATDKWNMDKMTGVYSQVNRWVKANPALVISAAAGILTGIVGVLMLGRSGSPLPASQYPNGNIYGQPYSYGDTSYDPATDMESYNPGSGSGSASGYNSDTPPGYWESGLS
jgi:hypothetical protein